MAAKPYRRRKNGKFIGNYRCDVKGRDLNLQTKDAHEALARARLAAKGLWPPIPAAVDAARAALDPGAPPTDPEPPEPAGDPEETGGGEPQDETPSTSTHSPPPRESPSHEAAPDLNEAARTAAEEASGRTSFNKETKADQLAEVDAELKTIMSELGAGDGGLDLLNMIADGGAAFLLFAERKSIELGVNWVLARRKSRQRLVTTSPEPGDKMRAVLRIGLKGKLVEAFPDFTTRLTPGWAIAIGMVGGAGQMVMGAALVDKDKGTAVAVADVMTQAQAAAQEPPAANATPPAS